LHKDTNLPLEEMTEVSSVWSMLGLSGSRVSGLFSRAASVSTLSPEKAIAETMLPFSARHPNEPLWIWE
jgi:hypothetical protein